MSTTSMARADEVVAGLIHARCTCCAEPRALVSDVRLDGVHLVCPTSRLTYLDRGDGWFEPDGGRLEPGSAAPQAARPAETEPQADDVLSDRPAQTGPKTRIQLERATFA